MLSAVQSLTLTDFRSYERATLSASGRTTYLFGPNGAGKTNLLEAISFLSPGKGLRGAATAEIGRRMPGEAIGRAWSVSALIAGDDGEVQVGTGLEAASASRRTVRIEGETLPPGRLADLVRPIWLTPQQDRLFLEGAAERRKFFDRLVFAGDPAHGQRVGAYDKAMRERNALLGGEAAPDPLWLEALEAQMAQAGVAMARARAETLAALQGEIDSREDRPFPQARLSFSGGYGAALDEAALAAALAASRGGDARPRRPRRGPPPQGRSGGGSRRSRPARRRVLHRRAESLDSQSGFGPGRATFPCQKPAESCSLARRSGGASRPLPTGRVVR
jgi:DNA replication and repair protein RecF